MLDHGLVTFVDRPLKNPTGNMKFLQTLSTCVLALSSLVSAASFSNPLKQTDGSDPHIVWTGGYYYLMTTTWTNLQITKAKTIEGLKTGERRTVWTDSNASRYAVHVPLAKLSRANVEQKC